MNKQDLYKKIRESAYDIEVPESLIPENVVYRLDKEMKMPAVERDIEEKAKTIVAPGADSAKGTTENGEYLNDVEKHAGDRSSKRILSPHRFLAAGRVAAAAVVLCLGVGLYIATKNVGSTAGNDVADASGNNENANTTTEYVGIATGAAEASFTKQNAGEMYVVAADYGEVYDALRDANNYENFGETTEGTGIRDLKEEAAADTVDSAYAGSTADISSTASTISATNAYAGSGTASGASDSATIKQNAADTSDEAYSQTNVQTEGVDEADIIKTDGKYIYVADEGTVHIIAADKGELYAETDIDVIPEEATASVCEIYVDGDTLCVIAEVTTSGFAEQSVDESTVGNGIITLDGQNDTDDTNGTDIYDVTEDMAISSTGEAGDTATYTVTSKTETRLLTYDIGDIKNPALSGSIAQDGLYYDSRKIGDKVFIFTSEYMNRPSMTREEAAKSENAGRWLPLVNGEAIACGDIYVPDEGDFGLVISSVDIGAPSDVIDTTLIISGYTEIYVSESAIYLYDIDYTNENIATAVAKFAMNDGVTDAVAAATVPGEVTDTFAISENNGILRVLTSDMSDTVWTNGLYLYDENMKLTGKLEDLALGEEIYAARYIGDVAYFVTYRNTDPLFAVDISDPSKPTVLSELKITGFSEYLHPWGTDAEGRKLLLGIGYETDPDTGNFKGMKLTMFDITDPSELNVIDTYVIKGAAYSPALYNYKAVLADPDKNLIGFAVTSSEDRYMAFSWEDGSFHRQLDVTLEQTPVTDGASIYESRSLYIGDYLYVASRSGLISYDMTDDFAKVIEYSTGSD